MESHCPQCNVLKGSLLKSVRRNHLQKKGAGLFFGDFASFLNLQLFCLSQDIQNEDLRMEGLFLKRFLKNLALRTIFKTQVKTEETKIPFKLYA